MHNQTDQEEKASNIHVAAMWLLASGFMLMLIGIIILVVDSVLQGNMSISGGGIVFIGPIPVIFGGGRDAFLAILLAAVLTVIGFVAFILRRKKG